MKTIPLLFALLFVSCYKPEPEKYVTLEVHFIDGRVDTLLALTNHRLVFECLEESRYREGEEYHCIAREVKYVKRIAK